MWIIKTENGWMVSGLNHLTKEFGKASVFFSEGVALTRARYLTIRHRQNFEAMKLRGRK